MELAKKISVYMFGIMGFILVALIFMAAYLMFVPNSKLFDYYYISGSVKETTKEFREDQIPLDNYEKIVVVSKGFDIELFPQAEKLDRIMVEFSADALGFTKNSVKEFDYTCSYDENEKAIVFEVLEPSKGLILYNNAYIKIGMPETTEAKEIEIVTKGGKVVLGNETPLGYGTPLVLETTSISITNTRAPMVLQNFTTTEENSTALSITNKSGRTKILSDIGTYTEDTKTGNVQINSEIGSFIFGDEDDYSVRYNIGGSLTVDTDNAYIVAGNVGGDVSQSGDGGALNVLTINEDLNIDVEDGETKVQAVLKAVSIQGTYNKVTIGSIGIQEDQSYNAEVRLENGGITIENAFYDLNIRATRGNVKVNNAYSDVIVTTTYGDVTVNYSENISLNKENAQGEEKKLIITTTEGNIKATNIAVPTQLQVSSSSSAKIAAEFDKVVGENSISAGRRAIEVIVPFEAFNYEIITKTGAIDVLVADHYKQAWEEDDYKADMGKFTTGEIAIIGEVSNNEDALTIETSAGKIVFKTAEKEEEEQE